MDTKTKKKNLLGYWMLTHGKLSQDLQAEFLTHPLVQEISDYNLRFAQYAIEREKKALLKDILEIVKQIEIQRLEIEREREDSRDLNIAVGFPILDTHRQIAA